MSALRRAEARRIGPRAPARRPRVVLIDVFETMLRVDALGARFVDVGRPEHEWELFFTRTLRDGMALTLAGGARPFAEVARAALRTTTGHQLSEEALDHVLAGFRELPPHPDVEPALMALARARVPAYAFTHGDRPRWPATRWTGPACAPTCAGCSPPRQIRVFKPPARAYHWACRQVDAPRGPGGAGGRALLGRARRGARRAGRRAGHPAGGRRARRGDRAARDRRAAGRGRRRAARPAGLNRGRAGGARAEPAVGRTVLLWTGHARSHHVPPGPRLHPGGPRGVPVLRPARPGDLRRQGQEPAPAAELLLRRPVEPAPAHPADGHHRGAACEWTVVTTEVEALQLEYNWIKEFDPRFNVRYRDDKSYPVLAVTLDEEYPRLHVYRGPRRKGVRYFGPYAHAWAIRETLDLLLRVFPARTCSAGVFKRHGQIGRPVPARLHRQVLGAVRRPGQRRGAPRHRRGLLRLPGRPHRPDGARSWNGEMAAASAELEFERAARLRDDLGALRRAMEKQAVVFGDGTDADVVAFAEDELEAAVQVFHVRGGRVRGQRGWVVDKVEPTDTARAGGAVLHPVLRRAGRAGRFGRRRAPAGAAGDPGAGAAGRAGRAVRVAVRAARLPGAASGCRSAATSGR